MRLFIHGVSALAVLGVGIYMMANFAWPQPPALSGLAFIIVAVNIWLPVCPICAKLCPMKK